MAVLLNLLFNELRAGKPGTVRTFTAQLVKSVNGARRVRLSKRLP